MNAKPPVNILMVDDQPGKLLSYETILAGLGENLIRANSGNEALEQLLRKDIAVVLVDVCMPELDGFELASMIRSHPRFQRTAIILISSVMVEDVHRLKGYDSGAMDYVSVPIIPEILRAKVAIFADLYRKTEALEQLNRELEQRVAERTAQIEISLKNAEDARRESDAANQLKDEFLAVLSHELRTPLNAITGYSHMLLEGGLDQETQIKAVETINRNALLQARLISDLLDVSRIVSGKLKLDLKPVNLPSVIQAAVDTIRPTAEAKEIQINVALGCDPGPVRGDAVRLQQVVWNLLSNATKFTPRRGNIQISLHETNSHLELVVQDDGPGIRPDFLPHIFESFRQGDSSSTRTHQGLGLGLAIVRNLLQLHGGSVQARNREDCSGALFKVVLPLNNSVPEGLGHEEHSDPNGTEDADWFRLGTVLKSTKVLVVDDEADAREVVTLVLERCGAKVFVASSASEAFELLQQELPEVLVADIEMPGEDGYSLVRRIRRLPSGRGGRITALALTAHAGAHDLPRLLNAGFDRHVPKPLQPRELITAIATLKKSMDQLPRRQVVVQRNASAEMDV
jgi:signal transduction histidine kinase/ActR/RegA family two-component response regulator